MRTILVRRDISLDENCDRIYFILAAVVCKMLLDNTSFDVASPHPQNIDSEWHRLSVQFAKLFKVLPLPSKNAHKLSQSAQEIQHSFGKK